MTFYLTTVTTPTGSFSLAVDTAGALVATAFGSLDSLRRRLHACHVSRDMTVVPDSDRTAEAAGQIAAHFHGERRTFDLTLRLFGTAFQQQVWNRLRGIPFGQTCSYGELAHALSTSPRAIGRANATNPLCLVIPCHRVIGIDGTLKGFAFGAAVKRMLLKHERLLGQSNAHATH